MANGVMNGSDVGTQLEFGSLPLRVRIVCHDPQTIKDLTGYSLPGRSKSRGCYGWVRLPPPLTVVVG